MCLETEANSKDTSISEQLQTYMQTLQFFDDDIDDYIYICDLTSERIYLTDKIRERFPLPPAGENGNTFHDWINIVYPKDRQFMSHYRQLLENGKIDSFHISYRLIDREKNKVWVNVTGTIRKNIGNHALLLVGRVSEMVLGRTIDSLTGLYSKEQFMKDLNQSLNQQDGYLMVIGVDNFKNINLVQGRSSGDDILKKITNILEQYANYPISLYRLDGDCFGINFPDKQQDDVIEFYIAIRDALHDICTISAGIVPYQGNSSVDSGSVYQYAENALDQAKREGKDRMVFFSEDIYQKNLEQIELLDEMKVCIQEDCRGFHLVYQPQINSQNFNIYGLESLLRYDSPSRGRIGPVEFIPLLEQSGLICPVGEWVLKTALAQCKAWREHIPDLHISVNISYVQLQQEGIADTVLKLVEDSGLPGSALTLEVTESIQLQDYLYFNKIFYAWKEYGIKVSIDDFGTGYSSLSYLKSIEIDEVKIDRCFVDHIQCNAYNYRLLNNMIELAHSANIKVCCEGVETVEELMALRELNADLQQGYLFAKPYTAEDFEQSYLCSESQAYQERQAQETKFRQMKIGTSRHILTELRTEAIGNIVESMDELVCVTDMDTYELYYLNAAGRRMTGVYDYKGCKCYQVLHGLDHPCEFCSTPFLREDKFHIWEMDNTFLGRYYLQKSKLTLWQGKIARLEIAFDITKEEIVSQSVQKKLNFESALVDAIKLLVNDVHAEQSTYDVLKIIGQTCVSDRVYIVQEHTEDGLLHLVEEWCAEGIASADRFFPATQKELAERSKHHMITAPIYYKQHLMGMVCVDYPNCADIGSDFVKTMAYFLSYHMWLAQQSLSCDHA